MGALLVVKLDLVAQSLPRFPWVRVVLEIHLLIFDGPPHPLGKDIVQRPPFAIHADLDVCCLQAPQVLLTGEVAALVAIADHWMGLG